MSHMLGPSPVDTPFSWSPVDQRHSSYFSVHEFIQPSLLDAEDTPEGYVSAGLSPAPCTKDSCDEEPCTASEHCTDTACNVAPCHDQECSQFWDELEPCISECADVRRTPCCEDTVCVEGWQLDSVCSEPHHADACAQQCYVDDSEWQYHFCPELHQTLCCGAEDPANVASEPANDALGILALTTAVTQTEFNVATSEIAQSQDSTIDFGAEFDPQWHQPATLPHQKSFPSCAFHTSGSCHHIAPGSLGFAPSISHGATNSMQNSLKSRSDAPIVYGTTSQEQNLTPCQHHQHKRRRLDSCCNSHMLLDLSGRPVATGSEGKKTFGTNGTKHCNHTSSHRQTSQTPKQRYLPFGSQPYPVHHSKSNPQCCNPCLLVKQGLNFSIEPHQNVFRMTSHKTRAHQSPNFPFCRHVTHTCCNPMKELYSVPKARKVDALAEVAHRPNSASGPSTPEPSISDQSSEYIYSPDVHSGKSYTGIHNTTTQVQTEGIVYFNGSVSTQHNSSLSNSINLVSAAGNGDHDTPKHNSRELKCEQNQQPGKPKETSDTCKWVLNPDATYGEWMTCNIKFADPQELTAHFEMHIEEDMKKRPSGEKKFYCRQLGCDRCNNTPFQQKGKLIRHVKSHSKDQRFKCEYCDKKFTTEDQRKTHINMIHLGTKSHMCENCGRGFSSQNLLNNHKRGCTGSVVGKLQCPLCMYATHDSSNLGKHKKNCHPELTYRCLFPGCSFEPSQDFSEAKKHFSMTRHCTDCSEDGSKEQEAYKLLMVKEARMRGLGKKSRWDPRPLDEEET